MTTGNKIMWKRGEIARKEQFLLFSTLFSVYLYFQESNYIFICEMWLFDSSFFLNSANLICRDTDISKYFREFLGLRDNESRLYMDVRRNGLYTFATFPRNSLQGKHFLWLPVCFSATKPVLKKGVYPKRKGLLPLEEILSF